MRVQISRETINSDFVKELEELSGENLLLCYQCGKCTAGCPVSNFNGATANQIIRMAQLGMEDEILDSDSIWLCASCYQCYARCPKGISIAAIMDALREMAINRNHPAAERHIKLFNKIFLDNIKRFGRQFEVGLAGEYNIKSGKLFQDFTKVPFLLFKGKLNFFPEKVKTVKNVKNIFKKLKIS